MSNIVFVYDHLGIGGIATYMLNMLKHIDLKNNSVTLLTKSIQKELIERIPTDVKIKYVADIPKIKKALLYVLRGGLPAIAELTLLKKRNSHCGKAIQKLHAISAKHSPVPQEQYDIAIGMDHYWPNYYTLSKINATKKYIWIHPQYNSLNLNIEADKKFLQHATKIFAVSQHNANILTQTFPSLADKIDYMENFIDSEAIKQAALEPEEPFDRNKFNIITVCRLDNTSKRIDRIIKCADILKKDHVDFTWRIVGDGPDRQHIENLIKEQNLGDCVLLMGNRSNPYPLVRQSDAFVLLSQYEGVPLVVTEAMILGLPVIVSNYESASSQVQSKYGVIVSNDDKTVSQQAATALKGFVSDPPQIPTYQKDNSESLIKLTKLLTL